MAEHGFNLGAVFVGVMDRLEQILFSILFLS